MTTTRKIPDPWGISIVIAANIIRLPLTNSSKYLQLVKLKYVKNGPMQKP